MRGFLERLPAGMFQIITTADRGLFPADPLDSQQDKHDFPADAAGKEIE